MVAPILRGDALKPLQGSEPGESWSKTYVVGEGGLEPPRVLPHRNLNPARLPIPPLARGAKG